MHFFTPQNFAQPLFSISLGTAVKPRRNEKQRLFKIWGGGGGNKVHYGGCGSGVWRMAYEGAKIIDK